MKNIFRFWRERRYAVQYNPKVLESELSEAAIDAILAHELVHIRSYLSLSRLELIGLALRYHFGSDEFRTEFERNTDLEAVDLGFAAGLRDYRLWLYEQLDPQAVAEKKRLYLRPEELEEISLKTPAVE